MAKRKKKDPLEGLVLVPKIGMDKQFAEALSKMINIAQGALGWDGHAELMKSLGVFKGTKRQIKSMIQRAMMQEIMEFAEWIPESEADKRQIATEVLYGDTKVQSPR